MKAHDSESPDPIRPSDHATRALHEAEVYLEHRLALDATLFALPNAQLVTYELEAGSLTLVPRAPEVDRPRK